MSELVYLAALTLLVTGVCEVALPATIAREGERAAARYVEFFRTCCSITNWNKSAQHMVRMSCQRALYAADLHCGP